MAGRPSSFRTQDARAEYCRWYDDAVALSTVHVEQSKIQTLSGTTHVLTAGDPAKPPLVALHAKAISSTMWLPLLPTLTANYHVRMLDAVGDMNKSVATGVLASPAHVTNWIDGVLDTLDIERSAFVAASQGAWMATQYAMARPGRVERLAMLCPAGIVSSPSPKTVLKIAALSVRPTPTKAQRLLEAITMAESHPKLSVGLWHSIAQQFIIGLPGFRANLREPRPTRFNIERLASSGIPVLAVIGRQETLHDGPTVARRLREQLPGAQVELVDGANHLVFIDRTDATTEVLRDFFGR